MEKSNAIVKVDTPQNWEKAINYIPNIFTIIVYDFENNSPKIKLGDGIHTVSELPFLIKGEVLDDTLVL